MKRSKIIILRRNVGHGNEELTYAVRSECSHKQSIVLSRQKGTVNKLPVARWNVIPEEEFNRKGVIEPSCNPWFLRTSGTHQLKPETQLCNNI